MQKSSAKIIISILCIFILGLTACSSNQSQNAIEGKYISVYDTENYLIFKKDGTFQNSLWNTNSGGVTKISDNFAYSIDENNIITAIDTTKYEGQDELNEYEIGIMYKDYICISWNGILSSTYEDTSLTNTLGDMNLTYNLKKDKTYEYIVIFNGEVVHTENGTYSIDNNEVVCTNDEGVTFTFIDIDGAAYCIEYIKE